MPARGKLVEHPAGEGRTGETPSMTGETPVLLGETAFDVYLNDTAYWAHVPARVWRYTIGGYQVIKKWLSYRERPLLGRDLTEAEARYVTEMVRRLAALVLLEPDLDENYRRVTSDTYPWAGE